MNIETIKKALGKKRLAKIEHLNFWQSKASPYRKMGVELIMKAPFIDHSSETVIDEVREPYLTQKEWLDLIKWRVDLMVFDPEGWNACGSTVPYDDASVAS